ncbi:MAG: sialidase family protein, partial [Armatimonadota bacterium]
AYSGWTEPVEVLSAGYVDDTTDEDGRGRQTYISLVCDGQDTLHIAFRQWRRGVDEHHPGKNYAALSVQSKPKDGPWGPARPLVIPPVAGYSIFYHKLTVDRRGRLFLSYNHWTSDETYQNDFPDRYHHRAVLVSKDGGKSWKLAETGDFIEGLL